MLCPNCQRPYPATARHCTHCGARVGDASVSAPPYDSPAAAGPYAPPGATPSGERAGASGSPLPAGALLQGRYRVARVLGAGAFGRVYLAEDVGRQGHPAVAIKELLDARFTSPEGKRDAITWFKREVSTLLALEHPAIPAIHGYWTAEPAAGPFYLAMDYIPGKTLQDALTDAGGRVHWPRVVAWGIALCDVLTYLHGRTPAFIFRDLKPPNVMLDERTDRPALIDFGIARQLATPSGTAIGTWGYMPFEQVLGRAAPASDLYALGATLHALLTGRQPDAEYTRLQRDGLDMEGALRRLFPPAGALVPDLPPALAEALARATAFAAADRFSTAEDMAAALRQARDGDAPVVIPISAPDPSPPSPPPPSGLALVVTVRNEGQGNEGQGDERRYGSIGAALRDALPGARIEARPGLYRESLVIDKRVEIVGVGKVEDIIVEATDANCLVMRADEAVVRGLTLCGRGGSGSAGGGYYAVDIPQGRLELEGCVITSDALACVAIHGETADPVLRRCTIRDGAASGVLVYERARGTIEDCDIAANALAGVEIAQESAPVIRRCTVRDGRAGGIVLYEGGRGTVEDCAIVGNARAGIEIRQGSDPLIQRCAIHGGKTGGVVIRARGRGTLADCDIHDNALADVEIAQGSTPTIRRCTIHDGRACGVLIYEDGGGTLEGCTIRGHALAGVEIAQRAAPTIRQCAIHDSKQAGIVIYEGGQGTIEDCDIAANALAGVETRAQGNAVLRGCRVNRNGFVALYAHDDGALTAEDCDLTGNAHGAWRVDAQCAVYRKGNQE